MRIRGAKTELEEAGESTEGMAESTASLRAEIKALSGIDIMLDSNTFKSTYDIMSELSQKWESLSDIAQATITELVAGKHQGNVMSSLMANFDIARDALDTSLTSSGSAMAEHAKWSESLEARLNKLKSTWQSLSQTFMQSDFLKGLIDIVTSLANGIDTVSSKFGSLSTLIGVFAGGLSLFSNKGILTFDKETGSMKLFKTNLSELKNEFSKVSTGIGVYNNNLSKSKGLQESYIKAISNQNNELGKYLIGLNGAKASFSGYISSLVGATVKTFVLEAATIALNAALTWGISALITWGISKLDEWIETSDELAERIGEVTSKYKEQHEALDKLKGNYDTSDEDSMISKYEKLSKGVNKFGENIALTAEEYSEYQGIVNTIAEQIPSLVSGYNSQGDAILSCADNVSKLTEEYKNLIKEQNRELLTGKDANGYYKKQFSNAADIFNDFKNDLVNSTMLHYETAIDDAGNVISNEVFDTEHFDIIKKLISLDGEGLKNEVSKLSDGELRRVSNLFIKNGIERNSSFWNPESDIDFITRAVQENEKYIQDVLNTSSKDLNAYAENLGVVTSAYFETAFLGGGSGVDDYSGISERMQGIITQITSGFDSEFYSKFIKEDRSGEENFKELSTYYNSLLKTFEELSNSSNGTEIEAAFDLRTQFNGGDITYGEYINKLQSANGLIGTIGGEEDVEVRNAIRLSLNTEEVFEKYSILKNRLTSEEFGIQMNADDVDKFLNELSASEYAVAVSLIASEEVDLSNFNAKSLREYIEREAAIQDALAFKLDISVETEALDKLNAATKESVDAAGLSSESLAVLKDRYSELDDYDPSKLFERTSQGIHLNREELNKLEKRLADSKLKEVNENLDIATKAYADVTEEIRTCSDETKRHELVAEQLSYANKIKELSEMRSQYEGLTSAYNNWVDAQEAGEEGDIYDDVIEKLESAKELREKGLVGTNEFAAATEFMSGKDTSSMTVDEIVQAYDEATPKMQRYFTDSSKGAQNLLNDLNGINKEWAYINENGEWKLNIPLEEAAEKLGISVDALEAVLGKGTDYGLTIDYDSVYEASDSLETLYTKAESANEKLKELGHTDLSFSFKSTDVKDLETQIENAQEIVDDIRKADLADDGKINFSVEGAEDAKLVLETLIRQKQEITKPAIMTYNLDTIEDEKLANVVKSLRELQQYQNTYEIQIATGTDTSDTETKIQEIVGNLQTLKNENKEIFATLGLDTEEFNSSLNSVLNTDLKKDVNAKLDPACVETIKTALSGIDATVLANVGIGDTTELSNLDGQAEIVPMPKTKDLGDEFVGNATIKVFPDTFDLGESFYGSGQIGISPYLTTKKLTVEIEQKEVSEVNGTANVDGTVFANGTTGKAFKQGSWGTKDSGTALVGELGTETLVRNGRFYTIGNTGAEFIQYRKGDIIFNHEQTKELFEHGKVTSGGGRGKMFANGTAFASGTAFSDGSGVGGGTLYYLQSLKENAKKAAAKAEEAATALEAAASAIPANVNGSGTVNGSGAVGAYEKTTTTGTSTGSSSSKDKSEETFDWIEIAISRIERAIDNLDQKANRTYASWSSRNTALSDELTEVRDEIELQEKAHSRYMKAANAVGLSSSWAEKVRNGKIDISTIKDEALAKKIKDYQTYYEKALACEDAILDLKDAEAELYKQKFDNIVSEYDDKLNAIGSKMSSIEQDIEQSQYTSAVGSNKSNYKNLISQEEKNITNLENKKKDLTAQLNKAVNDGIIKKYSEDWYAMREEIDATDLAIKESTTNISQYYRDMFDDVSTKYESILQSYEHTETMLNEYISQAEANGHIVSKNYYQALINNEKSNANQLKKEQSALIKARDEAVASGKIKEGSQEWYDMCAEIDSVTQAIEESTTALIEYDNAMREIDWSVFDLIQERISGVTEESDFLIELMSNKKLYEDDGKLTSQGLATMALHGQNYNAHMYQADTYAEEVAKLNKQIAGDPYDQELINRRNELLGLQRESILAAEDEKDAIRDMVEEGINLELDALQELIDKKNEELDSEKDLYEYQKKVKEQTEEIASLEKQMAAYSGDDSEEAKQKIQQIKVDLESAKQDLQETEYDKYISDQQSMLDSLYDEYELILNQRLDNIDALLESVIDTINAAASADGNIVAALSSEGAIPIAISNNANSVKETLKTETGNVGTTLSTEMKNIWNTGDGNAKSVLTMYGDDFKAKSTTMNATLDSIKVSVASMVTALNNEAKNDVNNSNAKLSSKSSSNSSSSSSSSSSSKSNSSSNSSSGSNGNFFVYKKDSYPKDKLDKNNSIVDRLKYHNYDSSFSARAKYYKSMGFKDEYTGSLKQNSAMISWMKKNGYKHGVRDLSENELAWTQENGTEYIIRPSDGAILTPLAKRDSVLNATASGNIWDMANSPAQFIKDNLNLGTAAMPNNSAIQNSCIQNFENVVFSMPNVRNYNELLAEMQRDPKFEKLVLSMSIDRIAGKSSLAKGKSIR